MSIDDVTPEEWDSVAKSKTVYGKKTDTIQ